MDLPDPDFFIIHLLECASPQFIAGTLFFSKEMSKMNKITFVSLTYGMVILYLSTLADMTNLSRVISSSAKNKITNSEIDVEQCKNGSILLASFGRALITASEFKAIFSSNKQNLLTVLNQTWKAIMLISNIEYYVRYVLLDTLSISINL